MANSWAIIKGKKVIVFDKKLKRNQLGMTVHSEPSYDQQQIITFGNEHGLDPIYLTDIVVTNEAANAYFFKYKKHKSIYFDGKEYTWEKVCESYSDLHSLALAFKYDLEQKKAGIVPPISFVMYESQRMKQKVRGYELSNYLVEKYEGNMDKVLAQLKTFFPNELQLSSIEYNANIAKQRRYT